MPEIQNGNIQILKIRSTLFEISSAFESLPLRGGRWRRRRRMRAESSFHNSPIVRDSRTFCRHAPPDTPKLPCAATAARKRKKSLPSLRRLPCREVRGDEGGLEGEETPPKGVSSPSKVFLPLQQKSTPPRQNAATGCGLNPHGSTRCFHSFVFGCRRRAVLRRTVSEPSSVAARSLVIR